MANDKNVLYILEEFLKIIENKYSEMGVKLKR